MKNREERDIDVVRLAHSYRRLVLWFGAQLVISMALPAMVAIFGEPALPTLALIRLVGMIITIAALALYAYRTAQALGEAGPVGWGALMVVPCLNALTLLLLSSKATKACRAAGIPVGFFGPRLDEADLDLRESASGNISSASQPPFDVPTSSE